MTQKCVDFYRTLKRQGTACGMNPKKVKLYGAFFDLIQELSVESEKDEEVLWNNLSLSAVTPLLKFDKGSDIRKTVVKEIVSVIRQGGVPTEDWVTSKLGLVLKPKPIKKHTILPESAIKEIEKNDLKDKIRMINLVLPSGQVNILQEIMQKRGFDNEYEALCLAIILAKEALDKNVT